MNIDESRSDDAAGGVDFRAAVPRDLSNFHYAIAANRDVRDNCRSSGAINHATAANDQVVLLGRKGCTANDQRSREECESHPPRIAGRNG